MLRMEVFSDFVFALFDDALFVRLCDLFGPMLIYSIIVMSYKIYIMTVININYCLTIMWLKYVIQDVCIFLLDESSLINV